MSPKIFSVIQREYLTRVKTKGFIIGTLLFPLIIVLVFGGIFIFGKIFQPSTKTYFVVDRTGVVFEEFTADVTDTLSNGDPRYLFVEHEADETDLDSKMDEFQTLVNEKTIAGYMVIPEDLIESRQIRYSARNVSDYEELGRFERSFSRIVANMRLEQKGYPAEEIRSEMSRGRVRLRTRQVTEAGEIEKSGLSSFVLTYLLTYIMFLMIMIYGQTLMRSVIEEKSQRITETIISSVKPAELMIGKLIGICLLGLTQMAVLGIFFMAVVQWGGPLFIKFGVSAPGFLDFFNQIQFTPTIFFFLLFFFLMGFAFFATLYAAVGAMVTTEDEGSQMQFPLIMLVMMGYFMMFTVARNPDTTMALIMSLIPPFTPILMFTRIAVSDPILPSGAILSIFTMIAAIALMMWLVAKIYRVGILMYGKKPNLKELIKWIKYK